MEILVYCVEVSVNTNWIQCKTFYLASYFSDKLVYTYFVLGNCHSV